MNLLNHAQSDGQQTRRSRSFAALYGLADYSGIVPDERRRRLLEAAMNVIAGDALENVTMDRIAKVAGVTRVTLYREFGNRGALLEAVIAYRLVRFDQRFFARIEPGLALSELVQDYLIVSTQASKSSPVSRRWTRGGMKFLHAGSLIHRVATATWAPVLVSYAHTDGSDLSFKADDLGLWLIVLQYSLGRMVVETGCDDATLIGLVSKFVSPAFAARSLAAGSSDVEDFG